MSRSLITGARSSLTGLSGMALLACLAVVTIAVVPGCGGKRGSGPNATAASSDGGTVVVRVDGAEVTRAEMDAILAEARLAGRADDAATVRNEAIRRELVRQQAARLGVSVRDRVIAARLALVRDRAGGAKVLSAALARAKMTSAQLRSSVAYGLLKEALAAAKFARLTAPPAAVRAFYERHRMDEFTRPATVRLGNVTLPSRRLAAEVVRRLAHGGGFAAVARQYSMDKETKDSGGMLGWISVPTLPAELRAAVAHIESRGVSDPVLSSARWHVLKVFARRAAEMEPFAAVRSAIAKELTRRRRTAALDDWLARARGRATVEVLP